MENSRSPNIHYALNSSNTRQLVIGYTMLYHMTGIYTYRYTMLYPNCRYPYNLYQYSIDGCNNTGIYLYPNCRDVYILPIVKIVVHPENHHLKFIVPINTFRALQMCRSRDSLSEDTLW